MSATPKHIDPETGLDTTSIQAMTRGEKFVYHPDPFRAHLVSRAASVMERFNSERDENVRAEIVRGLFKNHSGQVKPAWLIVAPFFCEYGINISLGAEVFIGTGATILDTCPVTIGSRILIGPNVSIYTPFHPVSPEERNGFRGHQ
ncbi:hypothetical protein NCC49_003710 [Naganishia albida]|nr:hypothetical protein NCC49_003710 [Naganishia albida]